MPANNQSKTTLEYRICWEMSSRAGAFGSTDWIQAEPGQTEDEISDELHKGGCCDGLDMALDAAGFGWYPEFQAVDA
jgi:hypothetical protein